MKNGLQLVTRLTTFLSTRPTMTLEIRTPPVICEQDDDERSKITTTMASTEGQDHSAPVSPGHTHLALPPPPLRSALKPSRPSTPTPSAQLSPLSSPFITHIPLPPSEEADKSDHYLSELTPTSSIMTSHPHLQHHTSMPASVKESPPHRPSLPHISASSPPPGLNTPGYTPKVSFDTFENPNASMFSFTLQVKSEGYKRTRNTRVFLCAASPDESGSQALDWCLESLVQDGDELIVFRGVDEEVMGELFFGSLDLLPSALYLIKLL